MQCPVCGEGQISTKYRDLEDRVFGSPIKSNLSECGDCGLLFQNPQILINKIHLAYASYYTHSISHKNESAPTQVSTWKGKLKRFLKDQKVIYRTVVGYFHLSAESPARNAAFRYGYTQSISFLDRLFSLSPRRREFGEQQLMFLRPVPYGRLLDFGCGNGAFIRRMTALGWQCDGVEFDERAVAFARELNPQVTIHKGGPETLDDLPENTYDAITLYGVIEHLHHPKSIVEKAFRLLKKGGRIVILMPNTEGIGHRFFNANWRGLEPPRHLNLFNQKNARKLFDGIPFENVKISSSSELAIYIWSMSREIQRGKFHFTRLPHLKFRIEAWLVYYGIWFLDFFRNQPIEKDSIKIEAVK